MERTISAMIGKGSVNHNTRAFTAKNVDKKEVLIMWNFARKILSRFIINCLMKHGNDIMQNRNRKIG